MALMIVGNICASMAPNYWVLLLGRFVSGLPHGAYFGVASIVAGKLADKGKSSEAVSIMIAGMTVANLFGVPLGTSLSHTLSWRATFLLVGAWGLITLYYIWRWVPQVEGLKDTGFKGQFRFLKKPAPWLILGATALGNGGVFYFKLRNEDIMNTFDPNHRYSDAAKLARLKNKKLFLFDIDGTIAVGDTLYEGSVAAGQCLTCKAKRS